MKVKDIYHGKPDARYENIKTFNDMYMVMPSIRGMDSILTNDIYYLIGNKGTGKTALLLYIGNKLIEQDKDSICSTILFKTEYDNSDRVRIESLEKQIFQTLDLSEERKKELHNYISIWKLTMYVKIIIDNKNSNYAVFEKNNNWDSFVELVSRLSDIADIKASDDLRFISDIPQKITFNITKERWNITVSDKRIPLPEEEDALELIQFNKAMKYADKFFSSLTRTSIPYCICVDELETSASSRNYQRDLQMIHDWMEVVWQLNDVIKKCNYDKMKIILSVRQEIIQAVERLFVGDEVNKKRLSYGQKVEWKYTQNQIGIHTPLIQILLKKIIISSEEDRGKKYDEVLAKWFPLVIGDEDICDFIYNRTWGKPRDVVRLLYLAVENAQNQEMFDKYLLISILQEYSSDSRTEIEEEMSAIYSQKDIKDLFDSVYNFKDSFSTEEYEKHIRKDFQKHKILEDTQNALKILYSYGIIGCKNDRIEKVNWAYQGDDFVEGNGWRYIIHPGLMQALNYEVAQIQGVNYYDVKGRTYDCKIMKTWKKCVDVEFFHNEKRFFGSIHVRELKLNEYVEDLQNDSRFIKGTIIKAYVTAYNVKSGKWRLVSRGTN